MNITIKKWGNSQGVRLPKNILEAINWRENDQLNIKVEDGKIVIEKPIKIERKSIKELFANFDGEYTPADINWGSPVGKEIW